MENKDMINDTRMPFHKSMSLNDHYIEPFIDKNIKRITSESVATLSTNSNDNYHHIINSQSGRTKMLVLQFDINGNAILRQISRVEILKLAKDAVEEFDKQVLKKNNENDNDHLNQKDDDEKLNTLNINENSYRKSFRIPSPKKKYNNNNTTTNNNGTRISGSINNFIYQFQPNMRIQSLNMRDLRKLEAAFVTSNEPNIVIRKQAIVVNADPIRAVILRNTFLVFVPDGADSLLSSLKHRFNHPECEEQLSFEFKALDAILATMFSILNEDFERTEPSVLQALDCISKQQTSSGELERLRNLKDTMNEFDSQANGLRRAMMEILDNEEDLRLICLSAIYEDPDLLKNLANLDPEEAEVLLESNLQDIHSLRRKVALSLHRIQNTESLLMLKLDSSRNYLLTIDVIFSLVAIAISVGTFISGIFGMNLNSGLQEKHSWFWSVTSSLFGFAIIFILSGIIYLKKRGIII